MKKILVLLAVTTALMYSSETKKPESAAFNVILPQFDFSSIGFAKLGHPHIEKNLSVDEKSGSPLTTST